MSFLQNKQPQRKPATNPAVVNQSAATEQQSQKYITVRNILNAAIKRGIAIKVVHNALLIMKENPSLCSDEALENSYYETINEQ